jgi:glutaredoxin-related protein
MFLPDPMDEKKQTNFKLKPDYLAAMIYLQQTDMTYDSVNFDDHMSTLSYFAKLSQPFFKDNAEEKAKSYVARITKQRKVQAQDIMRSAAEKIHVVFRESNPDSIATANLVLPVMAEAFKSLSDLARDEPFWTLQSY